MLFNLYYSFISDAMHSNASRMQWHLIYPKNSKKSSPKTEFLAHSLMFLVCTLPRLMSYALIFCLVTDLVKVHNSSKFHQYSIRGCQVESFQNFVMQIDSPSTNQLFLEGFSALNPPNMAQSFRNAYQRYPCSKQKHCLKNFARSELLWKGDGPRVCIFGLSQSPRFPLKVAKIKNVLNGKTSVIGLCNYVKIKAPSYLLFPGKIRLLFALFRLFLAGKKVGLFLYDRRNLNIVSAIPILTS